MRLSAGGPVGPPALQPCAEGVGIAHLGGHGTFLDTSTMQISHGESAKDTAVILSSYGHGIACRNCFWEIGNKFLRNMAEHSTVPIMNLQCDLYHPMQGLADLMTIKEFHKDTKKGASFFVKPLSGKSLFFYIGYSLSSNILITSSPSSL